jgi:hypothetical protein
VISVRWLVTGKVSRAQEVTVRYEVADRTFERALMAMFDDTLYREGKRT